MTSQYRNPVLHPYVRAYLAGVALPTVVVCVVGLVVAFLFHDTEPAILRALMLPIAGNPVAWGLWNVLWVALGRRKWVQLGWHGALLAVILIGLGVLFAASLDVPQATPALGAAVLIPVGFVYYVLWRYAVAFLNSLVGLDRRDE